MRAGNETTVESRFLLSYLSTQKLKTVYARILSFIWARRAHNKTVVASQGASTDSRFRREKLWLELSDGDENWHERWLGHGRRLEGLGFGIARAQRA